jgi:hypothetical protein
VGTAPDDNHWGLVRGGLDPSHRAGARCRHYSGERWKEEPVPEEVMVPLRATMARAGGQIGNSLNRQVEVRRNAVAF